MSPEQLETARVAVWLCGRAADAAGAWVVAPPSELAAGTALSERAARAAVARLVAKGFVALEKRGASFWLQATAAGRGPLNAYVLAFAQEALEHYENV